MGNLDNPTEYIKSTGRIIRSGQHTQQTLPNAIKNIIENKLWLKVKNKKGEYFKSFEELCIHEPWEGLDTTLFDLDVYLRKSPDVKQMVIDEVNNYNNKVKESKQGIDIQEAKREPLLTKSEVKIGNNNASKNKNTNANGICVSNKNKIGSNSKEYQLKRLARDNPEILDQLEKGEITSVRQAAIKAGIVKTKPKLQTMLKNILKHYTKEEIINELNTL